MARRAAAGKRGAARRRGGGGRLIGVIVVLTLLAAVAMPLCVLLIAGMLPSAVAAMVDRNPRRYLTACVSVLNFAGMVVPALALLTFGMSLAGVYHVLGDAQNWLIMYSAAGAGWVLHTAMLALARLILDLRDQREERRLIRRADQLAAEWGADVARD